MAQQFPKLSAPDKMGFPFPENFSGTIEEIRSAIRSLLRLEAASVPLPGMGQTAERWGVLARVGACNLSLAKIYEGHLDALAILAELEEETEGSGLLGVWAAEAPGQSLLYKNETLIGRKSWCSGASMVDESLVTAKNLAGENVLVRVKMKQPGVKIEKTDWANSGMVNVGTTAVKFQNAEGTAVGSADSYLSRPGFWQGGGGIAAVWYGGATVVAERLLEKVKNSKDPHGEAHLGAIYSGLQAARAALLTTAEWIDQHPAADAILPVLALRATVEAAAGETLLRTRRALGAGPICTEKLLAQRMADLEIYLRQSHAEKDLAGLGGMLAKEKISWLW